MSRLRLVVTNRGKDILYRTANLTKAAKNRFLTPDLLRV